MSRYKEVLDEIGEAAVKYGRKLEEIKLIAVVKHVTWDRAAELYDKGQRDFAESYVQDFLQKESEAPKDCRWHLIGTLQRNKVRKVIGRFHLIHSVDSLELAQRISDVSIEKGTKSSILLEVKTSLESTKKGMSVPDCEGYFDQIQALPGISVEGLMTLAPLVDDEKIIRSCFASLRELRDRINKVHGRVILRELSMGMSHDFPYAIAEGTTMVRIGTAIF